MALVRNTIIDLLLKIYQVGPSGNRFAGGVGHKTAKAYMDYCSSGMNVAGFPFAGMTGSIILGGDLAEIYNSVSPSGELTALKMAKAFNNCLMTFMSVNQLSIVTAGALPILQAELVKLFSRPKGAQGLFASAFGRALHNFTTAPAIVLTGLIPGTPPIPFTGPIS